jgi:putative transposase
MKRVMNKYGIEARRRKKRYIYPGKASSIVPNLLRDPQIPVEQEVMFSDIFEVSLADRTKFPAPFGIATKEANMERSKHAQFSCSKAWNVP